MKSFELTGSQSTCTHSREEEETDRQTSVTYGAEDLTEIDTHTAHVNIRFFIVVHRGNFVSQSVIKHSKQVGLNENRV